MRLRDGCPYRYNSGWFPRWFRFFLCKISITLTAKAALWVNEDIQIKSSEYLQYLDCTHKSQTGYQQNYDVFCGFFEDSTSSLTEKDIVVLKSHVDQKCFWSWDELEVGYVPSD